MSPENGSTPPATHCYEFDDFGSGLGRVVIKQQARETLVSIESAGEEIVILRADRDQWGVWIEFAGVSVVAQEDQTRSFLDALTRALIDVRQRNEYCTNDATVSA